MDGAGSSLTLSGVGGPGTGGNSENQGAFLTIGRETGSVGTATVTDGGSILIRDGGQDATSGGPGLSSDAMRVRRAPSPSRAPTSTITIESTGPSFRGGRRSSPDAMDNGEMLVEDGARGRRQRATRRTRSRNFIVGANPGSVGRLDGDERRRDLGVGVA